MIDSVTRRWIKSEADERAVKNGCRFNEGRGQHVVSFFTSYLTHGKQPHTGKSFIPLDWQRDELLMPLFGWERQDEAGRWVRRFQKTYIEIPKKNGKTSLAAGIGLYMLCADGWFDEFGDFQPETEAELYSIATSFGTAAQAHGIAEGIIQRSPELAEVLRVTHTQKYASNIDYETNRSFWRVLAASERSIPAIVAITATASSRVLSENRRRSFTLWTSSRIRIHATNILAAISIDGDLNRVAVLHPVFVPGGERPFVGKRR